MDLSKGGSYLELLGAKVDLIVTISIVLVFSLQFVLEFIGWMLHRSNSRVGEH